MPHDDLINVFFRFYSDILEEETTEIVLAEIIDREKGYYKIDQIPFYIPKIAVGDVVWAAHNKAEEMLTYRKTIEASGNSTINCVLMNDKFSANAVGELFFAFGCSSRTLNHRYFSINVPAATDYIPVKRELDILEHDGVIGYAESCLSSKHQYKDFFF